MVEIVEAANNLFGTYEQYERLISILSGSNEVRVRDQAGEYLLLTDGSVLSCICNYYELPDYIDTAKNRNLSLRCKKVMRAAKIDLPPLSCIRCHLQCLRRIMYGQIHKKLERKIV